MNSFWSNMKVYWLTYVDIFVGQTECDMALMVLYPEFDFSQRLCRIFVNTDHTGFILSTQGVGRIRITPWLS